MKHLTLILAFILFLPQLSHAWGKRGHFIVGQTAGMLIAEQKGMSGFKNLSFDLGYYNNVPDMVWKKPATYGREFKEHFMDLEIFFEVAKTKDVEWLTDRKAFLKKYDAPKKAGRAFWRVKELNDKLITLQKKLLKLDTQKNKKNLLNAKNKLQGEWLMIAGSMGHYIADMAQPLHTTKNYDGQLTNQKGVHSYFETKLVNHLSPEIDALVYRRALKAWPKFKKKHQDMSVFELVKKLTYESHERLPKILKNDKKYDRKKTKKQAKRQKEMLIECMSRGSLYLAVIISKTLTWDFNFKRFFNFDGAPKYIEAH